MRQMPPHRRIRHLDRVGQDDDVLGPQRARHDAALVNRGEATRNLRDDPEYDAHWGAVVPVGRAATADDACSAAVYLCSDEASYVNATTLMVDGGLSIM